jgi:hypothetical protein
MSRTHYSTLLYSFDTLVRRRFVRLIWITFTICRLQFYDGRGYGLFIGLSRLDFAEMRVIGLGVSSFLSFAGSFRT